MSATVWVLSRALIATAGGLLTSGMLKPWCKDSNILTGGRFMKGVQFLIDEKGNRTGVLIDLKKNGKLWEDFFDLARARERQQEPRESLEEVKEQLNKVKRQSHG